MNYFVTLDESSEELGVSRRTVRRMISSGELRAYRVGNTQLVRIRRSDLHAVLRPVVPNGVM